jgi:hypothetical protein
MRPLTDFGVSTCDHASGMVTLVASQHFVNIDGGRILIGSDTIGKGIAGCPNVGPTIKPCTSTINLEDGRSAFVTINGKPILLDTVVGGTDGTPPGATKYRVRSVGHALVDISS